jgi:hypothetical protein
MQEIFDHIKQIEKGNMEFYANLPDELKSTVNSYMLLKWMSYTSDKKQILHINALVNSKLFSLSKHKDLLFKLFCSSASGTKNSYKWLKRNTKKGSELIKLISDIHNCGINEAVEILEVYSKDDLLELCNDMNLDKIVVDKLKKEINVL